MIKTLYGKIAVVLLFVFLTIGVIYVVHTLVTTKLYHQEVNQRLHRELSEYLVQEENYYLEDGKANIQALKDTFERLMHINPSIELYLLDDNGKILAYSAPEGVVERDHVQLEPIRDYLGQQAALPILGDDPRDPRARKVFSVAPIPADGPVEAYLYIILGGEEYDSVAQRLEQSYILRLSTWVAGAGLLLVFAMTLFLFNFMTRRIRRLAAALDTFRQSEFKEPIRLPEKRRKSSGDEIDRLGEIASQMSGKIIESMDTIKQVDSLRREWVSNISHDLRTPLSSLQGYLETLLVKADSLSSDEKRQYIDTALQQSHRLGNLITELYDLARLDSPEFKIHAEPVNLGELVQDIRLKYQLKAEEKKVRIETSLPEQIPLVQADIALIERAIQNLIDNALSFSRVGGSINLDVVPRPSALEIRVRDDGRGILKEDIPNIFDRFYRGKTKRRDEEDDDSTGLGLAITKRILELHDSPINVRSEPDRGTEFLFELPLYSPAV